MEICIPGATNTLPYEEIQSVEGRNGPDRHDNKFNMSVDSRIWNVL